MSDGIVKKTGRKVAEEVQKAAKQVGQEALEIPKEAAKQVMGTQAAPVPGVPQKTTSQSAAYPAQVKVQEKARLDYLEKELAELVKKKRLAVQQELVARQAQQASAPKESLVEPTTRPRRGILSGIRGKQGTKEVAKPPSG
jgi:hypothetical protein